MEKFYYRRLDVYQNIKNLVVQIYGILSTFPPEEKYVLGDQLRRAVVSVASNLAEGFGRYSDKERLYFLGNANGSLMEVSCQIDVACDLHYIDEDQKKQIDKNIEVITKQLARLRGTIQGKPLTPNT